MTWMLVVAAVVVGAALLAPATAGQEVRTVHHSLRNIRYLSLQGSEVVVETAAGWSFGLQQADLRPGGRTLRVRPAVPVPRDAADREGGTSGALAGFPVSATVLWNGHRFTGTFGGGLYDAAGLRVPGSPADVRALLAVSAGLLVAHAGGLMLFDGKAMHAIHLQGPPADNVSALAFGGGALWVGYFDQGLAALEDGRWRAVTVVGPPDASWVNALCWHDGALWVGSNAGLGRYDPGREEVAAIYGFDRPVKGLSVSQGSLVVTESDAVWIASASGWKEVPLPQEALSGACLEGESVWAAGMRGLLAGHGKSWQRFSELNGRLPESWVTAVLPVARQMWVGTYDGGLLELGHDGRARMVRPRVWVNANALVKIPGAIAVGTMGDGLQIYQQDRRRWRAVRMADGLPADDVTAVVASGATLFVGTRGGLAELDWTRGH